MQNAFENIPERALETAATLRASPLDCFFSVVLPLTKPGYLTALVLGFAHTVGEFGVVLMIGGNIPEQTRVEMCIRDRCRTERSCHPASWIDRVVSSVASRLVQSSVARIRCEWDSVESTSQATASSSK